MKVYIFDLDDTLFAVNSISDDIGVPILNSLIEVNDRTKLFSEVEIKNIYNDCWKIPLDMVISKYGLNDHYKNALITTYENLEINHSLDLFEGYEKISSIKNDKFLVTTGHEKLQKSKIERLGVREDFVEIFIDIPHIVPRKNKEYYFKEIMKKYSIDTKDFIVVGDNLFSEITAAKKLGMTSVLFDLKSEFIKHEISPDYIIDSLEKILDI